jgi:hypothetical protein
LRFSVEFPLIGGPHQVLHVAPVAAALSQISPTSEVHIRADTPRAMALAEEAVSHFPGSRVAISLLAPSRLGEVLCRAAGLNSLRKLPLLWANRKVLAAADAIVVPECTSTILRRAGVRSPLWFCVPHGAGDRAVSFEKRFARFDHLLVAGDKTLEGMCEAGIPRDRVSVVGYPKADLIGRKGESRARLFADDRPTVIYNPHFRAGLSSLAHARAIVQAFAAQSDFNLIFAPHIRAFEDDASARAELEALAVPGRVHVDCGSDRLIDMSYIAAADIYLGDVSSQVYEFLLHQRPCVFINAHGVAWEGRSDYAFWNFGEVIEPHRVLTAIARAQQLHPGFLLRQQAAVAATFGNVGDAAENAARTILARLQERRPAGARTWMLPSHIRMRRPAGAVLQSPATAPKVRST